MKITMSMLEIFASFSGDIDGFARLGRDADRKIIDDEHWFAISELLQEAHLLGSDHVAPEFKKRITLKLFESTENSMVCERLLYLAQRLRLDRASEAMPRSEPFVGQARPVSR
ncbi:MAG: hypothetical protein V4857_15185 [Pseudomonadota bacterium]